MELVNITYTGTGPQSDILSSQDQNLVNVNYINSSFGAAQDYLELFIYDENDVLLEADYDATDYYPFLLNNPQNNTYSILNLDPEKDLKNRGYNRGSLKIQYNFYKRLFNSSVNSLYWIKEISTSRKELKLSSQTISDSSIRSGFSDYQVNISNTNYYPVFYLNFSGNNIITANNVAYTEDEDGSYLLIKLYEPLPSSIDIKSQLWIVDRIAEPVSFNVSIQVQAEEIQQIDRLRGPNYNVQINNKSGQTTPYYTYNNLLTSPITSSFQKLASYYDDKAIAINVDYSNFKNFVHFSSAVERVNNFVYKLQLIETASTDINIQKNIIGGSGTAIATSSSIGALQSQIDNLIKNFDTYEYFLYFDSSSWAWPKRTKIQPYTLYSVTSSQALNFLGGVNIIPTPTTQSLLFSASYYDDTNKDILRNSIPQYILDDSNNQPYLTFIDMIGQHFDNIWLYYKDLSNRYNATNNPDTGISLDVVADALRGFGIQLYTNSNVSDNLYYTLFGINPDGSLLPPTGSERITNYVTSSLTTLSAKDIQSEFYKRLYHNLPYLLKTKGTERGVKALISTFGIPDEILTVREFGGNPANSVDGILDLDTSNYKINIDTGSNGSVTGRPIISTLLSPYTTNQTFNNQNRINSLNVEVGFSPADTINSNITASLGYFDIDQLIGSPGYQYSSSYNLLVSASNSYFTTYNKPNSIWEYIRLIKFYNNSLFKMIKDFVPARANLSTGIIVKSHMLERNKYARHEPTAIFQDFSQSIDTAFITASSGGAITKSTSYTGSLITSLGVISKIYSDDAQRYTGEFSGSNIIVTTGKAMNQNDYSNMSSISGSNYPIRSFGALHQNITASVKSIQLLDLDYNADQLKPVNYGIITQSINAYQTNNYSTYTNPNNPYAQVQDYNYKLKRSIIPRYSGSKTISSTYTTYTIGDSSYGKTAAIDKLKYQYAYLVDIYSSSFQMPYRAKGQMKYIINNSENVLDLSKINQNLFEVQNIFKSGEYVDVSLFDYDVTNPYIQKLNNEEKDFTIWESGYNYSPLIYNNSGSLRYTLPNPTTITVGGGTTTQTVYLDSTDPDYWTVQNPLSSNKVGGYAFVVGVTGSVVSAPSDYDVTINYVITNLNRSGPSSEGSFIFTAGSINGAKRDIYIPSNISNTYNWTQGDYIQMTILSETKIISQGTPSSLSVVDSITENNTFWQVTSNQNQILISPTQSLYYGQFVSTGSYEGLDAFVFPFIANSYDLLRLYNYSSSRWDQTGEFRIKSVESVTSGSPAVTYIALNLDRNVDKIFTSGSNSYPLPVFKYLLLKRLKDETNIYFNYNLPKSISQDGILFPQYIAEDVKANSGNVIKSLKQQNII